MRYWRYLYIPAVAAVSILTGILIGSTASASVYTLYPNSDPADLTGVSTTSWLSYNTSIAQYQTLKDPSTSQSLYLCGESGTWGYKYGMDDVPSVGQGAYAVEADIWTKMRRASLVTTPDDDFVANVYVNGAAVGSDVITPPPFGDTVGSTCTFTFNSFVQTSLYVDGSPASGTWSTNDINSMQLYMGRKNVGTSDIIKLFRAKMTVNYDKYPIIEPNNYRVYQDSNTASPGTAITNYDTPANLTSRGQKFRLRMAVANTTGDSWLTNFGNLNLQYSRMTASSCQNQSSGWSNVSNTSKGVRFYDNPAVTNNSATTIASGDQLESANATAQSYRESNNFSTITEDFTGLSVWDFSLQEEALNPGGSYCFKIAGDSPITSTASTTHIAQVNTLAATASADMVDDSGASVTNPSISFSNLTATLQCQSSSAQLATSSQKIYVTNGPASSGWSVSVAPTAGATALWTSTGGDQYDMNDSSGGTPGCSDGGDADTKAGQLSVKPSGATVTPWDLCSNTGVSAGSDSAYQEGSVSSITLLTGSSSSPKNCSWQMTNVGLTQQIPGNTPVGTYSLDLTMTAVAS